MTLHEAVDKHGSKRAAAKALGIPWTSFRRQYKAEKNTVPASCVVCKDTGTVSRIESCYGFPAETVIEPCVCKPTAKSSIEQQVTDAGFSMDDVSSAWIKSKEHSVQVKKRPQTAVELTPGFVSLLDSVRKHVVRKSECRSADSMLIVSLCDTHFGKRAWRKEAGEDYDAEIASAIYRQAVSDALAYFNPTRIKKIVVPIGHDLLHVDNLRSETTAGTRVDSTDTRFHKVFDMAVAAVVAAVEDCASIADVYVPVVPGNHDENCSVLLSKVVKQYFKDDPRVTVDDSEICRKYLHWGCNLICMTHRFAKPDAAPNILATEAPWEWGMSTCREVHTGHFHTRRATAYRPYYETHGVVVRVLPSLSATDTWHHTQGYIGSLRAAESYLYSEETGIIGSHLAKVRC